MSGKSFVVFYFLVLRKVSAFLSDFGNSDTAGAWEVIEQVKSGKITGRTAYGELVTIKNEWPGTAVVNEAEY